jgi:hypothetical protein
MLLKKKHKGTIKKIKEFEEKHGIIGLLNMGEEIEDLA